jgi:hypothetical protein
MLSVMTPVKKCFSGAAVNAAITSRLNSRGFIAF